MITEQWVSIYVCGFAIEGSAPSVCHTEVIYISSIFSISHQSALHLEELRDLDRNLTFPLGAHWNLPELEFLPSSWKAKDFLLFFFSYFFLGLFTFALQFSKLLLNFNISILLCEGLNFRQHPDQTFLTNNHFFFIFQKIQKIGQIIFKKFGILKIKSKSKSNRFTYFYYRRSEMEEVAQHRLWKVLSGVMIVQGFPS